jgi:hypothetical protein
MQSGSQSASAGKGTFHAETCASKRTRNIQLARRSSAASIATRSARQASRWWPAVVALLAVEAFHCRTRTLSKRAHPL